VRSSCVVKVAALLRRFFKFNCLFCLLSLIGYFNSGTFEMLYYLFHYVPVTDIRDNAHVLSIIAIVIRLPLLVRFSNEIAT
jgi:hypothetical protein